MVTAQDVRHEIGLKWIEVKQSYIVRLDDVHFEGFRARLMVEQEYGDQYDYDFDADSEISYTPNTGPPAVRQVGQCRFFANDSLNSNRCVACFVAHLREAIDETSRCCALPHGNSRCA